MVVIVVVCLVSFFLFSPFLHVYNKHIYCKIPDKFFHLIVLDFCFFLESGLRSSQEGTLRIEGEERGLISRKAACY